MSRTLVLFFITVALIFQLSQCGSSSTEITEFVLLTDNFTSNPYVEFRVNTSNDDNVSEWLITTSQTMPNSAAYGWRATKPTTYTLSDTTLGKKTLCIWIKIGKGIGSSSCLEVNHVEDGDEDTENWNKKFDGGSEDSALDGALDSNGNLYVVGYGNNLVDVSTAHDWWIKKFDPHGVEDTENWDKKIDGNLKSDRAYAVAVDSLDNIYVAGNGDALVGDLTASDWWIKKFDSEGVEDTTFWDKKLDGNSDIDLAYDIAVDSFDNVFVVGMGKNIDGGDDFDWWIIKFNSAGEIQNELEINNTTGNDEAKAIAIDSNDNIYVAGYYESAITQNNWWIKKYQNDLSEITTKWDKQLDAGDSGNDHAMSIAIDSNDNIYVAGSGTNLFDTASGSDIWIKRFNSAGDEDTTNWDLNFDGGDNLFETVNSIAIGMENLVYVGAYGSNLADTSTATDWWLKAFTPPAFEYTSEWNKKIDGNNSHDAVEVIVATDYGTVYAIGYGSNLVSGSSQEDWWIKKYADYSSGNYISKR